jgi:hypothetical protein
MSDVRDSLFSDIHREWLKPRGFRKHGRKSIKSLDGQSSITVELEKYPATPGGPYRFSIDVRVACQRRGLRPITYQMSLPSHVDQRQFWSFSSQQEFSRISFNVKEQFRTWAVPALLDMETEEGLLRLFDGIPQHVSLVWYWTDYVNLLNRTGRAEDAKAFLCKVVDELHTREDIQQRAKQMLAEASNDA